jgi:sugar lactone lactonase YvrE
MLGDVLSVVPHQDGAFGYGKMHAQMVAGADGMIYATTYWGTRTGLEYTNGYEGDVLLRIDPSSGSITNLGVPVPNHGIPTLAASPDGKLIFGEAAESEATPAKGLFFVYDIAAGKVVFQHDKPDGAPGYRSILVDGSGKAWFSVGDGQVAVYDPSSNSVSDSSVTIPGQFLRAATHPAPDGTVYGVTQGGAKDEPDVFFKVSPDGQFTSLGAAQGYTTSLALSDDGATIYYVPDAHGDAYKNGTPLIARNTSSGQEQTIVRLNDLSEPKLNLRVGGSYDVALDPTSSTLFIGLNAGDPSAKDAFGSVVLAVVKL